MRTDTGGLGLVGMRERVATDGGTLHAGPRRDGGFLVRAYIPLGGRDDDEERGDGTEERGDTAAERGGTAPERRSEEHTSELQSRGHLVCRLLLEKKKKKTTNKHKTQSRD